MISPTSPSGSVTFSSGKDAVINLYAYAPLPEVYIIISEWLGSLQQGPKS
jgi:hypothetical protein